MIDQRDPDMEFDRLRDSGLAEMQRDDRVVNEVATYLDEFIAIRHDLGDSSTRMILEQMIDLVYTIGLSRGLKMATRKMNDVRIS
jgi:hypothetical protein